MKQKLIIKPILKSNLTILSIYKVFIISLLIFNYNLMNSYELSKNNKIKIAISKASKSESYFNYSNWVKKYNAEIEIVDLIDVNINDIENVIMNVDGLVLSGGPDLDPIHFDKVDQRDRCSIDLKRDSIELKAIEVATKKNIPILGICRGLQILNVYFGGDLITDIPTDVENHINHQQKSGDSYHKIIIENNTLLHKLIDANEIEVNSNHHQSIGKISDKFIIGSKTSDGVIESIEFKELNSHWIFAVQWHPERLDYESNASKKILFEFVKEVEKNKK